MKTENAFSFEVRQLDVRNRPRFESCIRGVCDFGC
jgi:hypothetical protein